MTKKPKFRRVAFKLHKWAGLGAGLWLFVLGATGIVLDHDEWRWARQMTVPGEWISPGVGRLLPATKMRHVAVDAKDSKRWLGGSERGLWWTDDGGESWTPVRFEGVEGVPQILDLVPNPAGSLAGAYLATDDGIWVSDSARSVRRVGFEGLFIHHLTTGSLPGELVGLVDHDRVFRWSGEPGAEPQWVRWPEVEVAGLPDTVSLYRFVFDLHFGYGIGSRTVSTLINDYGGFAFMVLALSGFLFWWFPKRWRRAKPPVPLGRKRRIFNWLYRAHAPIIGLLALLPIGYLAATAIPLIHVGGFGTWANDVALPRKALTPVYQYGSLAGELDSVVAYPDQPDRFSVGTRFGILHTDDGGESWKRDRALPAGSGNFFRAGSATFFSDNGGRHFVLERDGAGWQPLEGLATAVTDAARLPSAADKPWILKNSRGFNAGSLDQPFAVTDQIVMPDLPGATLYLFLIDIHLGLIFHRQFKWINDLVSVLALVLVLTGPILWWRTKWR